MKFISLIPMIALTIILILFKGEHIEREAYVVSAAQVKDVMILIWCCWISGFIYAKVSKA